MRREKQREGEEKGEREAGTEELPASCERECPPRLEARRRRRAGGGDPWASGRDPWKPSDVTGQRRIAAGFLPPPPVPSVPPAPRGPGAPRPSRLSPLPLGVYPSRSLCAPARRVVTLEGNPRQWEGRGGDRGRTGQGRTRMLTSLEASCRGQRSVRTRATRGYASPFPPLHLCPT